MRRERGNEMLNLFSDAEAADMIERIQPLLAGSIRRLILARQSSRQIKRAVAHMATSGLIKSLIDQAIHHCTELRKPISDDDGVVLSGGITYRYNVIDNYGVARWDCREYITEQKPSYQVASMAIRKWIAARNSQ